MDRRSKLSAKVKAALPGVMVAIAVIIAFIVAMCLHRAQAHDKQMRESLYSDWLSHLYNQQNNLCCEANEGTTLQDVDWSPANEAMQCQPTPIASAQGDNKGAFCVFIKGVWWYVPDKALVREANKYGPAVVWPIWDSVGGAPISITGIRCFMPGAFS